MHSVFAEPDYAAVAHDMQNELARLRDVYQVPPNPPVKAPQSGTQTKSR
jgi:hypothetical protein